MWLIKSTLSIGRINKVTRTRKRSPRKTLESIGYAKEYNKDAECELLVHSRTRTTTEFMEREKKKDILIFRYYYWSSTVRRSFIGSMLRNIGVDWHVVGTVRSAKRSWCRLIGSTVANGTIVTVWCIQHYGYTYVDTMCLCLLSLVPWICFEKKYKLKLKQDGKYAITTPQLSQLSLFRWYFSTFHNFM